jgi:tellurite resistance protein TerC
MTSFPTWAWLTFAGILAIALAIDLTAHRGDRADSRTSAYVWSGVWVLLGLAFGGFIWAVWGSEPAGEYLAAYLIEKSLSLDNLFVFLVIFESLSIPRQHQRRVLSWGIFGALVFRALFIFAGAAALARWEWVAYAFGAILFVVAYRVFREDPAEKEESRAARWLASHLPVTHRVHGPHFFASEEGRWQATPLLVALIAVEVTDILFAIDSVPAAFSVTQREFLIYTSNAFAILGLRALYIALAASLGELVYLHYGLAVVLAFAGVKLVIAEWIHIPAWLSIAIIVGVIGASIAASIVHHRRTLHTADEPA